MSKPGKQKVVKKKPRIPVPQRPPKIEKKKNAYDRRKLKRENTKLIEGQQE